MAIIHENCKEYIPVTPIHQDLNQVNYSKLSHVEQRQCCDKLENCAHVHEFERNNILGADNHYKTIYFKLLNLFVRLWNDEIRVTATCIEIVTGDTNLHESLKPDENIDRNDQQLIGHTSLPRCRPSKTKSTGGFEKQNLLSWTGTRRRMLDLKIKISNNIPKWLLFLCTSCFTLVLAVIANPHFVKTFQNLPDICTQLKECPAYTDPGWQNLNTLCCSAFKDEILHCQPVQINGTTIHLLACLKNQSIPAGKTMGLVLTDTDEVQMEVSECDADHYDEKEKMSYTIREPVCPNSKIECSEDNGKYLKCKGGPTKDDQCLCQADHSPYPDNQVCRGGFSLNNKYNCQCRLDPCPVGYGRNISPAASGSSCDDSSQSLSPVDYSCQPLLPVSIENTSMHQDISTNSSSKQDLENWSIYMPDFETRQHDDLWWLPLLAIVLTFVIILIVLALKRFVLWYKRQRLEI